MSQVQFATNLSHTHVASEVHLNHADEEELPNNSASKSPKIVYTAGEIFADGSIIELVSISDDRTLGLLLWNQQPLLAPEIDHNGSRFLPLPLTPSVRQKIRFPDSPTDFASSRELLDKISRLFETYIGLS